MRDSTLAVASPVLDTWSCVRLPPRFPGPIRSPRPASCFTMDPWAACASRCLPMFRHFAASSTRRDGQDRRRTDHSQEGDQMMTSTSMLGFRLPHPFVAGASPLGWSLDTIKRLEDGGCAALVLPSLFEEQITLAAEGRIRHRDPHDEEWASSLEHFPGLEAYSLSPEQYAEHVSRVKRAVGIPVIGSLNGTTNESWLAFSRLIEQAGADALELNLYEVVTDLTMPGATVEHQLTH